MSDVQIAIIDQENIEVNLAVPGIQGAKGDTGTVGVAADGTAAAPGISFASDTNTGIYRPGADQLAISTGGTGRLFVDASGNVGVGGSTTTSYFTNYTTFRVNSAGTGNGLGFDIAGAPRLFIVSDSAANYISSFSSNPIVFGTQAAAFTSSTAPERARIRADGMFEVKGAGTAGSSPAFSVNGSAPGNSVLIDSNGRLGVGTTSPGALLHSYAGASSNTLPTNAQAIFENSANGGIAISTPAANAAGVYFPRSTNAYYAGVERTGADLSFLLNGSTRATIDSSGRLLVGSTSNVGAGALQVFGGSVVTDNAAGGQIITVLSTDNGATNLGASIGLGGKNLSSQNIVYGAIAGRFEGTGNAGYLQFATTNNGGTMTEKMKISSAGLIICSNAADNMFVVNTAASGTSNYFFQGYSFTDLAPKIVLWNNGNVVNTNNSYGTLSDIKLKENIVDANSQWDDLKALRVRNFNLKAETGHETHTQIGLIAQEVELVSPGLVIESPDHDKDGNDLGTVTKSVSYSVLYMKAVKALQEAMERIETLEAKVAALEAQ